MTAKGSLQRKLTAVNLFCADRSSHNIMTNADNCSNDNSPKTFFRCQTGQANIFEGLHPMHGCYRGTLRTVNFGDGQQKS